MTKKNMPPHRRARGKESPQGEVAKNLNLSEKKDNFEVNKSKLVELAKTIAAVRWSISYLLKPPTSYWRWSTSSPCTSTWMRRPRDMKTMRRKCGKIATKNPHEEKVYKMSPADKNQYHWQPHHHMFLPRLLCLN